MFTYYAKSSQDTFKTYFEIIQILRSDFQQRKENIFFDSTKRRRDTWHNDTQNKDTQHNNLR